MLQGMGLMPESPLVKAQAPTAPLPPGPAPTVCGDKAKNA